MRMTLEPVNEPGERIEVSRFPFRIGRSPQCDLRISDRLVSRVHCELAVSNDDSVIVRDLHSENGTLLNGKLITRDEVVDGGVLTIGLHSFRVRKRKPFLHSLRWHQPVAAPERVSCDDGSSVVQNA